METYWIAVVSFALVFILLGVVFFILKSGSKSIKKVEEQVNQGPREWMGVRVVRYNPASESLVAYIGVISLFALESCFNALFILGSIQGWDQQVLGFSLAMAFMVLAMILYLYWKEFLPEVLIEKEKREKIVPEREFEYSKEGA